MYLCIFFSRSKWLIVFIAFWKHSEVDPWPNSPSPSIASDTREFSQTFKKLGHLWLIEKFCSQIKLQDYCLQFSPAFYSILHCLRDILIFSLFYWFVYFNFPELNESAFKLLSKCYFKTKAIPFFSYKKLGLVWKAE